MVFGVLRQQGVFPVDGVPRECAQQDRFELGRYDRIDSDFRISDLGIEVFFETSVKTIDLRGFIFELLKERSPLTDLVGRCVGVGIQPVRFL